MPQQSGIYTITCQANGKQYVGSAKSVASRWRGHRCRLNKGDHHSPQLQAAWNKYGEQGFGFAVIVVCAPIDLILYEQLAIDMLKPKFNTATIAGNTLGVRPTPEQNTRQKAALAVHRAVNPQHYRERGRIFNKDGRTYTVTEAGKAFGMNPKTISKRLRAGMPFEVAVTAPLVPGGGRIGRPKHEHQGLLLRIVDIARATGERVTCVSKWLRKGIPIADILAGKARQRATHTRT